MSSGIVKAQDDFSTFQSYTPSILLKRNQIEIKQFNNLYTQTKFFDTSGNKNEQSQRSSFFTSFNTIVFGVNSDLNIGLDFRLRSASVDPLSNSALGPLKFRNDGLIGRSGISGIGPVVRFRPFRKWSNVSLQTSLLFPLINDLDGQENGDIYLDYDGYQLFFQFFWDKPLTEKLYLFSEVSMLNSIDRNFNSDQSGVSFPIKVFLNYFPNSGTSLYVFNEFTPNSDFSFYYYQVGMGGKYAVSSNFEIELLYSNFLFGKNSGAGQTFNIGLRYVKW